MPKRFHSSLILVVVFVLGIGGGIAGMVWAWPGIRSHLFHHHRPTLAQYLKPLGVSPQQMPQIETVFKQAGDRRHELHLQFVPDYAKVCESYMNVRHQEQQAYAPVHQQFLDQLRAIMTADQWNKFQQMQRSQPPHQQPDQCRHLYPGSVPPKPAPAH